MVCSPFGDNQVNVLSQGHPKTLDPFFGYMLVGEGDTKVAMTIKKATVRFYQQDLGQILHSIKT